MNLTKTISDLKNLNKEEVSEFVNKSDICIYAVNDNNRSKNLVNILDALSDQDYPTRCVVDVSSSVVSEELRRLLQAKCASGKATVCIDITYIERNEMAEIFAILADAANESFQIDVAVVYALAVYHPPSQQFTPNDRVSPAHPRFSGWYAKPQFPVTAVVGLGYEKDKAIGAIEYIEADNCYVFIPSSVEEKYITSVHEQNALLLKETNKSNIVTYNVHDPVESIYMLNSIIVETKKSNKPALFPFGPKIFFSASLIVALVHPEVSVWYVSGEHIDNKYADQETASLISYKFSLSN